MESIQMTPIGIVKNTVKDTVDENWGKVLSEIHLDDTYTPGLQGIEDWSHVVVIFHFHLTEFDPENHLVRHPRNRKDMPEIGIFAQRARHHPNLIGTSAVKIVSVRDNVVTVKGLDAIDGTPVLDLKPYAPIYDGARDPSVPGWFIRLMQGYF